MEARYELAVTQNHTAMEGRDLVQVRTIAQFESDHRFHDPRARHPEKRRHSIPDMTSPKMLGHGDRPDGVRGLQRLASSLPGREQYSDRGKEQVAKGPRDALAAHRPLLPRAIELPAT